MNFVFGGFEQTDHACAALAQLVTDGFDPSGFSIVAPETMRAEVSELRSRGQLGSKILADLIEHTTQAPDLAVDNTEMVASGAVPELLEETAGAGMEGFRGTLERLGAGSAHAARLEDVLKGLGVVVAAATRSREDAQQVVSLMQAAGAREVLSFSGAGFGLQTRLQMLQGVLRLWPNASPIWSDL